MKKNKSKKDILAQFINDAKDKNFSDKLATIKTLQKVEKDKFDQALMELRKKKVVNSIHENNNKIKSEPLLYIDCKFGDD